MAWGRTLAATLLLGMAHGPSALADSAPTRDYFIGHWGIGEPEECNDRDTMSFYESGAWAVTNGGSNPVEAIGLWELKGDVVTIIASDLRNPAEHETIDAGISEVKADMFIMEAPPLGGKAPLYRCSYG